MPLGGPVDARRCFDLCCKWIGGASKVYPPKIASNYLKMSGENTFELDGWCSKYELDSATLEVLKEQKLTSEAALQTLSHQDCADLELPMGQRNLLRAAVGAMRSTKSEASEIHVSSGPQTTQTLARNQELNDLVKSLQGTSLKDLLTVQAMEQEGACASTKAPAAGENPKPLLIPDFVSKPKGVPDDEEEITFNTSGQAHLFLRSRAKPKVDQVTLAMWVSANARILRKLIDSEIDDLTTVVSLVKTYLDYTAQVGDFCQSYTTSSVMLLDDAHRRQQAKEATAWNDVNMHAMFYHLEKKSLPNKESSSRRQRAQKTTDSSGREICINYNNPAGCRFPNCRYAHVCLSAGCKAAHPMTQHSQNASREEVPPRFR